MRRNSIRIVCNPYLNNISYYFQNELGEWDVLSENSPLSRQYYTNTTVDERCEEILKIINEIYNRNNKGVDIIFEGTSENYNVLRQGIEKIYSTRDITYELGTTKIAVAGKKCVGKSLMIEGLETLQGLKYSKIIENDYVKYSDECNHAEWYEINGIDLGKENMEKSFDTIKKLSENNLSAVIYCITASTSKIEESERIFIKKIADDFSKLKVMIVLTMCYRDDVQDSIDEIEKITDQVKIVPILAKEYKTGLKNEDDNPISIASFGLEEVSSYIFEGR